MPGIMADIPGCCIPGTFLWLPDRAEDQSGLVCKNITFWQRIGSRVFERGGNDGFGGFLRVNIILEKIIKTSFRDQYARSSFSASLHTTLEHFEALRYTSFPYLPFPAHLRKHATTHHTQALHTSIDLPLGLSLSILKLFLHEFKCTKQR